MSSQDNTDGDGTNADGHLYYFDPNNEQHMQIVRKRMLEGKSFRAPSTNECPDDIWESWRTSFMSCLRDDPKGISKVFRYVWYDDEEGLDNSTARYGVAQDFEQLVKMITTGQIKREDITYKGVGNVNGHPSKTAWSSIAALKGADYRLVKEEVRDPDTDAVTQTLEPLADHKLDIIDQIIIFLTGDFYRNLYTVGGVVTRGGPWKEYVAHYDEIFKALRSAHEEGNNCVPIDMSDAFKDGVYGNYSTIMKAMKRRYNRCRTHETMTDWFRKIDKIVELKCPMEFKVQKLRSTLKKLFFGDESAFPTCSDFPGDKVTQMYPEEFTPSMAMLVAYILFDKLISRNQWEKVQREFFHEIEGKATYDNWHKNRLELWRKMDDEIRSKSRSNVAQNINNLTLDGTNLDPNDVNEFVNYIKNRQQPLRNRQAPPRYNANARQGLRNGQGPNRPRPNPNRQFGQKESIPNRLKKFLCRSCSSWAGVNKYHEGGFGGGPDSKCPFDRNGNKRLDRNGKPFKFIKYLEGLDVDNIPVEDYKTVFNIENDYETEGLEYEEDDEGDQGCNDHLNYAANQMLQEALNNGYAPE